MGIIFSILLIIAAYFLGSVPFGLVFTKMAGLGDVRKIGSGNIGATNVLRTGNKKLALATLIADALKGVVAVIIAKLLSFSDWTVSLVALSAVLGHIFPVWLKFKGGKGVATALAVYLAVNPVIGISACLIWLGMFFFARMSSLSSISAMFFTPIVALYFGVGGNFLLTFVIGGIVIYRHKENIMRILRGEEISLSKTDSP